MTRPTWSDVRDALNQHADIEARGYRLSDPANLMRAGARETVLLNPAGQVVTVEPRHALQVIEKIAAND